MHTFFHISLILLLSCAIHPSTSTTTTTIATHTRRNLHQPLFPQASIPPTQPPSPQTPLSTSTPTQQPFFPTLPSPPPTPSPPPPPSPSTFATFPANVSSLNIPQTPKPKKYTSKLVAVGISLVLSAVLVAAIAFFLCIRMRRRRGLNDDKACESESSSRWFHSGAGNGAHEHGRSPPPSSEFLYLGTLVNSRGGGVEDHAAPNRGGGGGNGHARKMDSPELHPLPPLTGRQNYGNAEMGYGGDEEDEEFYSPRGSSGGGRESSIATRSASRRAFAGVVAECESSSSYSSSSSDSPTRSMSVSISISPPVSLSPISSRHKSPELVALQVAPPPSSPPPIMTQFGNRRNLSSLSPSSSPDRPLLKSQDSSNVSEEDSDFPVRMGGATKQRLAVFVPPPPPPPPPPLPPPRTWVSPVSTPIRAPVLKPPVLIKPSRPVVFQSPKSISPMELPPQSRTLEKNEDIPKPKLKPLHWDKVRASSGREMVWDQLKSSSFKLNEEMIETLFLVNTPNTNMNEPTTRRSFIPSPNEENRVLDPKKSQNIAISLRALNVTIDEVCEALVEGNADSLGPELLECLLKMAPTKEEERKLREYNDDSPFKLGPAERFLKAVLDIPFAFKRVDAMLYIANFDSEVEYLKRSFGTLEAACEELKNSRMFLKLLEAVLKTGNRMNVGTNRGDAQAFKLDTLLKLVDIKAADGKTNLLHFVVQEIIKSEGTRLSGAAQNPKSPLNDDSKCRKLGLQVVSGLSSELTNVKKAAAMDSDVLSGDVLKLSKGIVNIREVIRLSKAMGSEESSWKFSESMNKFMKMAEEGIVKVQAQESLALSLVKEITEYFHGNSAKEEAHPFRIFMVVRDFLTVLDRVCKEVGMINEQTNINSTHKFRVPMNPTLPQAFIGFPGRPICNSSDDESSYS